MKRKTVIILVLIIIISIFPACGEKNVIIGKIKGDDGADFTYKRGIIEFADELPNDTIYYGEYDYNSYSPLHYLTIMPDKVVYTANTAVYTEDKNDEIFSLCRDPVCDHSKPETCIVSFGLISHPIPTDEYIYFLKATTVFRYSLLTMTTDEYAVFNIYLISLSQMGRYLYVGIAGGLYVKIDLVTDTAMVLEPELIDLAMRYSYDGKIYLMDASCNIYESDDNMDNIKLLASDRNPDCFIQSSYEVYNSKLYYVTKENEQNYLCVYDLETEVVTEKIPGVFCFTLSDDIMYMQFYDPQPGPEYMENGEMAVSVNRTGNKIYTVPINDLNNKKLLNAFENIYDECTGSMVGGNYLYATGNYLYADVTEIYNDYSVGFASYRLNIRTNKWQRIAGFEDPFR